jgi:hypothetical protein
VSDFLESLPKVSSSHRYCDDGRLEIDNNAANAASGIGRVMPRGGLCRVGADWVRHTACSSLVMRHK